MTRLQLLFIAILLPLLAVSQNSEKLLLEPYTHSFNEQFGFHEKTIYDILEVDEGFYFGSNTGLYFFDGDSIFNYSLAGYPSEYTHLTMDPEGHLWFSNFYGQIFRFKNGVIELFIDRSAETNVSISFDLSYYPKVLITDEKSVLTATLTQNNVTIETLFEAAEVFPCAGVDYPLFLTKHSKNQFSILRVDPQLKTTTIGELEINRPL